MGHTPTSKLAVRAGIAFAVLFFILFMPFMAAAQAEPIDPLGGDDSGSNYSEQQDSSSDGTSSNSNEEESSTTNEEDSSNPVKEGVKGNNDSNKKNETTIDDEDKGREFIKGYNPLKEYDPTDSKITSAALYIVGKITSFLIWMVVVFFFLITAFDLIYILVPFMRPWLNDANEDGQGNSMPGIGGGSMGMGGYGAMGANQTAQKRSIMNRQWVSDEAVECVKLLGGSSQAQMGGGGMMGSPMSGFGGYGAMGMAPEQDGNSTKSVLGTYVRKRLFTMIILGLAIVLLTGSTLMGFGMDIGTWIAKFVVYLSNKISGADVPSLFE